MLLLHIPRLTSDVLYLVYIQYMCFMPLVDIGLVDVTCFLSRQVSQSNNALHNEVVSMVIFSEERS